MADKVTFYRFLSEVRAFLAKLVKEPIKAQPSKFLKDNGFGKTKLIGELMKRDILERHEKILDSTNSDETKAKYVVKYKVKKKDFENRVHRIYIKYFEKNEPEKENLNEEGEGGACGCNCGGGATGTCTAGDYAYTVPFGEVQRRPLGTERKKSKKSIDPTKILGKTISTESKKKKRIFITEEQLQRIMEETTTTNVGSIGDYTANGLVLKDANGKPDPTIRGRKIKVKQFK